METLDVPHVPNEVKLIVPRVDIKHGADACHVVSVAAAAFDVLVTDGHAGKQLKVLRRLLA